MSNSIGGRLVKNGILVLVFIVLMIISSQVVVGLFKETSKKLVVEYNELDAIEELKMSLSNLLTITSAYVLYGNKEDVDYFETQLFESKEKLKTYKTILTDSHDIITMFKIEETIDDLDSLGPVLFGYRIPEENIEAREVLNVITEEINDGINRLEQILIETRDEINQYVEINNTVIRHSTITILGLGTVLILILIFGGSVFIRSITKPIMDLVAAAKKISKGDKLVTVKESSIEEMNTLAKSFNEMVETIQETTVSKNYLNNILSNMFDALIVTDNKMIIRSINTAALNLLQYKKEEIIGKSIEVLFEEKGIVTLTEEDGEELAERMLQKINAQKFMLSSSGNPLPVLISTAALNKSKKSIDGLVIVGHDLTEKIAAERELEKSRKERLIAINEAHEEERIRIATDLHDGLGQMLTAISYSLQNIDEKTNGTAGVNKSFAQIRHQINQAITETKNLAHTLIPIVLKDFGLVAATENLINRANELSDTKFSFETYGYDQRIDPKLEKVIYRICQESVNNIIKHSKAKNASFQLFRQDEMIVLVIEDDGVGFVMEDETGSNYNSGIGLISMRERVLSFDGNLIINTSPGKGTELIIEVPCIINVN